MSLIGHNKNIFITAQRKLQRYHCVCTVPLKQQAHAHFEMSDCVDLQKFASHLHNNSHELCRSLHGVTSTIVKCMEHLNQEALHIVRS